MAHKKYVWQTGYLLSKEGINKLNPQPIAERLEFLRDEGGGSITPDDIINDAKNAESPLAQLFTNSIQNDAYEYRKQIARMVVNSLRVEIVGKKSGALETQYAWVSLPNKDNSREYVDVETVSANKDQLDRLLLQAERDLARWERRYDMLLDIVPILSKKVRSIKKGKKSGK